jgi:hypothetical protein
VDLETEILFDPWFELSDMIGVSTLIKSYYGCKQGTYTHKRIKSMTTFSVLYTRRILIRANRGDFDEQVHA